jgi:hypothetical protein
MYRSVSAPRIPCCSAQLVDTHEEETMTRPLCYLALLVTAACGSGRTVRTDPEPSSVAPAEPAPVAPAPAYEPSTSAAPTRNGNATDAAPYAPYGAGSSLPLRRIGQWSTSGISTPAREVIRDDGAYARFWAGLGAGERPSVDFSRDVVIAVAAGQRNTGGHTIAVERVVRDGAGLAVTVVETQPGAGCMTTQQLTQPVDIVVVAAADARTWSFSDQSRTQPCQ